MRHVVLHGHFYQPPREEPWLEMVPRELAAGPDRDWNHRITRECYAPLGLGRLLSGDGRVRGVLNGYGWLSTDLGPTLARWLERHDPAVLQRMVEGDRQAITRLGHGGAIAAPYHHVILPLASLRDKRTEVRWGLREFRRVFGRDAVGMWLPETAVDDETLQVLAEEGVRFTILAPHQVEHPVAHGRPVRWNGAGGRSLALCIYDGSLAHEVAFGTLLASADQFVTRLTTAPLARDGGPTVTGLATDGETFGHHHKFGDLALIAAIEQLRARPDVTISSYEAVVATLPATDVVTIVPYTSWSCPHNLGRWLDDCGCRMSADTNQRWRAPLRAGLQVLSAGVHAITEREWPVNSGNAWDVRDAAGPDLDGVAALPTAARRLLEAERHLLATSTSCAWFFDDLARIEVRLVLRHAARALEFLPTNDADALRTALLSALAAAESNDPADGDGVIIWHRDVLTEADGTARLAAGLAALRELSPGADSDLVIPTHTWEYDGDDIATIHRRTGLTTTWRVEPLIHGLVADGVRCVRRDQPENVLDIALARVPLLIRRRLRDLAGPLVMDALLDEQGSERLAAGSLAPPEARDRALARAWDLVERDGLEVADVLLHSVIDLYILDEAPFTDRELGSAFERLSAFPVSARRALLAKRLGLDLTATA